LCRLARRVASAASAALVLGAGAPIVLRAQAGPAITLGTEYGFGGLVAAGNRAVRFEIAGGFAPVLFYASGTSGGDILKIYFPAAVGAQVGFALGDSTNERSLKLGVTYNTLIKLGVGGGLDIRLRPKLRLAVGVMVYREAKELLVARVNKDDATSYSADSFSAPLAGVQPFGSVTIFFR
jgi:hypothetical protein